MEKNVAAFSLLFSHELQAQIAVISFVIWRSTMATRSTSQRARNEDLRSMRKPLFKCWKAERVRSCNRTPRSQINFRFTRQSVIRRSNFLLAVFAGDSCLSRSVQVDASGDVIVTWRCSSDSASRVTVYWCHGNLRHEVKCLVSSNKHDIAIPTISTLSRANITDAGLVVSNKALSKNAQKSSFPL